MAISKSTGADLSHLKLDIRVDRLSDFSLDLPRNNSIFIRYYIFAGNGERIRVDTREVSPSINPVWDEATTMECQGRVRQVLEPHTVVFELRRRQPRARSLLSSGSKLLGRGEVAWKDVLASPKMSIQRCVRFGSLSSEWRGGLKTPGLLVEMKVEAMEFSAASSTQRAGTERCGRRKSEGFGSEDEMLLAAATMNAW